MVSYDAFIHHFQEVFDLPDGDTSVQVWLLRLRQGSTMSFHEYTQHFRTLATDSGWNEPALITVFRQGIEPALRLQLAGYDDTVGLERFILLAIRVVNRREQCLHDQPAFSTPARASQRASDSWRGASQRARDSDEAEPMNIDSLKLSPEELIRRRTQGLCLYCGGKGHVVVD